MKNWAIFFKERTPLISYLLISFGPVISGMALFKSFQWQGLLLSFLGFFSFLIVLRMMDEYKDFDKDVLAHKKRPLPRGLIALPSFKRGINWGLLIMIVFDFGLYFFGHKISFYLYSLVIIHLWLMYKEFYFSDWLIKRPLFYAFTHQLILITLSFFCLFIYRPDEGLIINLVDGVYALSVLCSFFTYEISRKLDPSSHPVLKTYLFTYGLDKVIIIILFLMAIQIMAIFYFFQSNLFQLFFYFPLLLLAISYYCLKIKRLNFKWVEVIATINLLFFLYSGIFYAL